MLLAVQKYDASRGASFSHFAWRVVSNGLKKTLRNDSSRREILFDPQSISRYVDPREFEEPEFDSRPAKDSSFVRREQAALTSSSGDLDTEDRVALYQALETLDDTEKRIIDAHFFKKMSQREIAKRLGCSHTNVQNILHEALRKLRLELDEDREVTPPRVVQLERLRELEDARRALAELEGFRLPNIPARSTLRRYGLSLAGWLEIIRRDVVGLDGETTWVCPVCGVYPPTGRTVVDHRHVRGWKKLAPEERKKYVRGVVCVTCNHFVLTRYGTPAKFRNAAEYLDRFAGRSA